MDEFRRRASSSDSIGLYSSGAPDTQPLERTSTAGQASGTMFFTAPATAGTYELRYISGSGVRLAVSNPVVVTAPGSADTTAPIMRITTPTDGQSVSKTVSVTVSASDNAGVARVELYVDGAVSATSTTSPFTMNWNSQRVKRGTHTLRVKAYEAAGNSALSEVVTVYR